jgi:hypothetical protein
MTVTVTWLDGSSEVFTAHDTEVTEGYLWLYECDLTGPPERGIPLTSMRMWTQAGGSAE